MKLFNFPNILPIYDQQHEFFRNSTIEKEAVLVLWSMTKVTRNNYTCFVRKLIFFFFI